MSDPDTFRIRMETSADGLVLIADVEGEPAAAIDYASGEPVGRRGDRTLLSVLRAYRWAFRNVAAVWVA
jgi:hypothetical protein